MVAGCELRVRVAGFGLRVAGCEVRILNGIRRIRLIGLIKLIELNLRGAISQTD